MAIIAFWIEDGVFFQRLQTTLSSGSWLGKDFVLFEGEAIGRNLMVSLLSLVKANLLGMVVEPFENRAEEWELRWILRWFSENV